MVSTQPIAKAQSIDEYMSIFPKQTQRLMQKLRMAIHRAAPKATEVISYGMPAFRQDGVLVYFAAYKAHIGFYPTGSGILAFKNKITDFKYSKGAIQFPLDQELPIALIQRIVKFRVEQNKIKALAKSQPKTGSAKLTKTRKTKVS